MPTVTEGELRRLLRGLHRSLTERAQAPGMGEQYERAFSEAHVADRIAGLEAIIKSDDYHAEGVITGAAAEETRRAAAHFAAQHKIDLAAAPPPTQMMVYQGVARALLEDHRLYLHRLTDRLTPYAPKDNFFASASANLATEADAFTLDAAFRAYETAKAGVHWKPRTVVEHKRVLRWAREFFGADTPVTSVTKSDIRNFRDAILTLRKKGPGSTPFNELIGAPEGQAISRKTASKYYTFVTSAFAWFANEGHITASPVGNISVAVPKSKKGNGRVPFSQQDLTTLFSSPMYVGCKSPLRRMTPGSAILRDGFYWVPLIGALSGMRLGEIIQLGLADVALSDVAHFNVRADEATGGTVKSDAGWRAVPIHDRLLELGFGKFVAERQKNKSSPRLFAEIKYGSDGSPSGEYSRWFGRRLGDIGLTNPGLVFHSLRGSFIGALTELGAPAYIIKAVVGHDQSDDITFGYSGHEGVSLAKKKEWVDKVLYLSSLPPK